MKEIAQKERKRTKSKGSSSPRPSPPGEGESFAAQSKNLVAEKIRRLYRQNNRSKTKQHPVPVPSPGGEGQDEGEQSSVRPTALEMNPVANGSLSLALQLLEMESGSPTAFGTC